MKFAFVNSRRKNRWCWFEVWALMLFRCVVVRIWQVAFVDEVSILCSGIVAFFRSFSPGQTFSNKFSIFNQNTFSWRQTRYQASTSSHKVQSISVKTKYRIFQLNSIYLLRVAYIAFTIATYLGWKLETSKIEEKKTARRRRQIDISHTRTKSKIWTDKMEERKIQ